MNERRPTFYVKQFSTLPVIKYPLSDYLKEKYDVTNDMLDNCAVTFSMYDVENKVFKIANNEASLVIRENKNFRDLDDELYTLEYKLSLEDTAKAGYFEGEFKVDFFEDGEACGKITFPVNERIAIYIQETITKTDVKPISTTPNVKYTYYYGIVDSNGAAAGVNRPTADASLLVGKVPNYIYKDQTLVIPFNSTSDDYIWFAISSTLPDRVSWYVSDLNNGAIGGAVFSGGNLFPDAVIDSGYKFYVSNYQTITNLMQIRNS